MTTPARLFVMVREFVFILLGGLLAVLALSGRYVPDRHNPGWLVLAIVIVLWGMRAWWRASSKSASWQAKLGGGSLLFVGGLMVAIAWAPFDWVQPLVVAIAVVLVLRGLVGTLPLGRTA